MRLGGVSVILAAAMIVLGYFVIRGAYANPNFGIGGMSRAVSVMFPFTDIVNFTVVYSLAFVFRRNATAHKRLMLLAGILIIDPAAARLAHTLGASIPALVIFELALIGALIVYDLKTRRRPSWASLLGLGLFILAMVMKLVVAQQPGWSSFVESVFA
jgi:hypothetical protein